MRLLVVEDEVPLARYLVQGLREEGYAVDLAGSVAEGSERAFEADYDLMVLDLMLPDGNGLSLLDEWRGEGLSMPVLILTARDSVGDKVAGLDRGGDDYLTKPFEFEELLARIRSLLRRREVPPSQVLEFGELKLERNRHGIEVAGRPIELTAREFALLEYFMLHPRRVLSRGQIAEHAWDQTYNPETNVIDVLISRLRKKIHRAGGRRLIRTVKGLGYVLSDTWEKEP